ncbi:capping protein, Arp2/3 and myosin-I linker protein 3-like, partial [Cetorhinus maximus]
VLTAWRMCLLNMKIPTKIESTFNFLEIRNLTPVNPDQVVMETEKSTYSVNFLSLEDLDRVMSHINTSLNKIFPASPPSLSQRSTPESPNCLKHSPTGPAPKGHKQACCGGFSETYAALCDYNGVACREEVQWDVDTIYHSQDTRHFNILDFSHLGSRDLALIVAALAYNQWFTKLHTRDLKLGSEVIEQVLHTVSRSRTIEELEMENTGLKVDFAMKLAAALAENPFPALTSLNLASNPLEDKGVYALSQFLASHHVGLKRLNLSRTSLTLKGLVPLAQTLNSGHNFTNTLTHLDLSRNAGMLAGDDAAVSF